MPEVRFTRFGYDFCIHCSQEQPRIGRVVTMGEGDHTWNEIEFLDTVTAKKISEFEKQKSLSRLLELDLMEEDTFNETVQEIQHKLSSGEDTEEEDEYLEEEDIDSILEEESEVDEEDEEGD